MAEYKYIDRIALLQRIQDTISAYCPQEYWDGVREVVELILTQPAVDLKTEEE